MRNRNDTNERNAMRTATNGYTAIDSDGNVVITCMTREQAAVLVDTMQANGVAVHIHAALDDTEGSRRRGAGTR